MPLLVSVWTKTPDLKGDGSQAADLNFPLDGKPDGSLPWRQNRRLIIEQHTRLAGNMGTATFRLLAAARHEPDEVIARTNDNKVFAGQWVAVLTGEPASFDVTKVEWWGYIAATPVDVIKGRSDEMGLVTANEIGQLLDMTQVEGWRWAATADAPYGDAINSPPTANMAGRGGVIIGNALTLTEGDGPIAGVKVFARKPSDCGTDAADYWTRYRLLEHYAAYMVTGNDNPDDTIRFAELPRITLNLPGDMVALLDDTNNPEVFDLRQVTLKGFLDLCIPDAMAFIWRLELKLSGQGEIEMQLDAYPLATTPATADHPNVIATPVNITLDNTTLDVAVTVAENAANMYDRIVIRGAPYVFGGTVGHRDSNLNNGWTDEQLTAFTEGAGIGSPESETRAARRQPHAEDVGVRFTIHSTDEEDIRTQEEPITGSEDLGTGSEYTGGIIPFCPRVHWSPTGTVAGDKPNTIAGAQDKVGLSKTQSRAPYMPTARVLADVPWPKGVQSDYTDLRSDEEKARPQFIKPRLFTMNDHDEWVDLLSDEANEVPSVQADAHALALRIRYRNAVDLLLDVEDSDDTPVTDFEPPAPDSSISHNPKHLVATIAIESDQRLEIVKLRSPASPAAKVIRTLRIDRPDFAAWFVRKNTVLGLKDTPLEPDRPDQDFMTRNDHPAAQRLADLVASWAWLDRRAATIETLNPYTPPSWASLGTVIGTLTEINQAGEAAQRVINTGVVEVTKTYIGQPGLTVRTSVARLPQSLIGGQRASPAAGGQTSLAHSGTVSQGLMQSRLDARNMEIDHRTIDLIAPRAGSPGEPRYLAIDNIRAGVDISTVSGVIIEGIEFDGGAAITSVPTVDPDDTDEADLTDANLGKGTLRSTGETVWVSTYLDDGENIHFDLPSDIPEGASILCVDSVNLPGDDVMDSSVPVYIPKRM